MPHAENINAGIMLIDSNYTLVAVNPAQARMFGKAVDELVGKKCFREFFESNDSFRQILSSKPQTEMISMFIIH